jgi:hypothetical protein
MFPLASPRQSVRVYTRKSAQQALIGIKVFEFHSNLLPYANLPCILFP